MLGKLDSVQYSIIQDGRQAMVLEVKFILTARLYSIWFFYVYEVFGLQFIEVNGCKALMLAAV